MVPSVVDAQDRRKHPRVAVNLPAVYRSANMTVDVYVANLSQSGAFVTCSSVDPVGTEAKLLIALPSCAEPLRVVGRVVWAHRCHPRCGMGLAFAALGRDERLALANFLIARSCNP